MAKIIKNNLGNFLTILFIFLLLTGLVWSGLSFRKPKSAEAQTTTEILRPTAHTDAVGKTTNPQLAYDPANGTTWANTLYDASANPSITFHTWQTTVKTYTSLVLKYRYHADAATDDTYAVAYSVNGGSSWTDLVSSTKAGVPDTTVSINLSPSQDLSLLRVKIYTTKTGAPDRKSLYTRDIWTEGTYEEVVIPPATWKAAEDIAITGVNKNENIRMRITIANSGGEATGYDYLLEYAPKIGATCGDNESFIAVPVTASTEHFEMRNSAYVSNGEPTTAKLTVPSCCPTFVPGKIIESPSNSSGAFTLSSGSYTEFEFVFWATVNATDGGNYCFRITNAGVPLEDYSIYSELQISAP